MRDHKHMSNTLSSAQLVNSESAVTSVATKWGMGGGASASVYGWLTSSEAIAVIGILITVLGFIVNWFFQRRRDKREVEVAEFRRQMELAEEARRVELHQAQLEALKQRRV